MRRHLNLEINQKERGNSLGDIIKTFPHLLLSVCLTPFAIPYAILGSLDRIFQYGDYMECDYSKDPVARHDLASGFLRESKFLNFWGDGFDNFYNQIRKNDKNN